MSFLAKFAASKYVGDKLEENFGPENPQYDILVTADGRRKKVRKPSPPGLSAHDAAVLKTVRRRAWRYEWWVDCHCLCGLHLQFGTVTLWGLLPVIGDVISLLHALSLIRAARKVDGGGLPFSLVLVMLLWAAVDFAIKLVPLAGEILTAIIKPNTRNAARVEAFLRRKGEKRLREAGVGPGGLTGGVPGGGSDGRRSGTVHTPLLVATQQPQAQRGMNAAGAGAGAGAAGTSYGTVRAAGAGTGPEQSRQGRREPRHLLPFWRQNEESDSDEEEEEEIERRTSAGLSSDLHPAYR